MGEILSVTGSSSTEDDGAAVGPLTFGAAMTLGSLEDITPKELYADRINKCSAQSGTLKSLGNFNAS